MGGKIFSEDYMLNVTTKGLCVYCTACESEEALTNWALNRLSVSYRRRDYDVTKYWTMAGVQRGFNAALELRYRYAIVKRTMHRLSV